MSRILKLIICERDGRVKKETDRYSHTQPQPPLSRPNIYRNFREQEISSDVSCGKGMFTGVFTKYLFSRFLKSKKS